MRTKQERLDDRNATICWRYEQGESGAEIARAYGITNQRVHQILDQAGVVKRAYTTKNPPELHEYDVMVYVTITKRITVTAINPKQARDDARFQIERVMPAMQADGIPYSYKVTQVRVERSSS